MASAIRLNSDIQLPMQIIFNTPVKAYHRIGDGLLLFSLRPSSLSIKAHFL